MKRLVSIAMIGMLVAASPTYAKDKPNISAADAYAIEKMAMAEAEGEAEYGKALVMNVIFNRVESNKFPNTVTGVIYQPGQFASISNGRYDAATPDVECVDAMEAIQTQGWDASNGALYFEGTDNADNWHKENLYYLFQYNNHLFYGEK